MTATTMGTKEVIDRYVEAWKRGDVGAIVDCYHDDFTIHYFGKSPLAGDHVGKAAALSALGKASALTGRKLVEVHDVLATDSHAVILAKERFDHGNKTLDVTRVFVYHVMDGRLAEAWCYDDDQRAVDEFWSSAT